VWFSVAVCTCMYMFSLFHCNFCGVCIPLHSLATSTLDVAREGLAYCWRRTIRSMVNYIRANSNREDTSSNWGAYRNMHQDYIMEWNTNLTKITTKKWKHIRVNKAKQNTPTSITQRNTFLNVQCLIGNLINQLDGILYWCITFYVSAF
jgi:hypothetical protein